MEELLSINLKPSTRRTAVAILEMYAKYYSEVDIDKLAEFLDEIKSEARKEFAERLDELFAEHKNDAPIIWARSTMELLLQEMESESNAE